VTDSEKGIWRHEIDRANAQVHTRRADLTIGRQAIGWGRGVMLALLDAWEHGGAAAVLTTSRAQANSGR